MKPWRSTRGPAGGFTLVELVLALAILAMLLVALLTFVFSMGELWGHGREQRLFEQHVNAVARHVESLFRRAALPTDGAMLAEPFAVREVRTAGVGTPVLLSLDLPEGDRLFQWPAVPLPDVRAWLAVEPGEGLVIYWQSNLEADRDTQPARRVLVSPLVTGIRYLYFDPAGGRWDERADLLRAAGGRWQVPDRVVLAFAYGPAKAERAITLPLGNGALPVF